MADQLTLEKRKELGRKTAETLLKEIKIPDGVKFQRSYSNLMSNVPGRSELGFFEHIEGKGEKQITKESLLHSLDDIVDNTLITTFCCASLEVNEVAGFDIDHVFPFARIRKKQEALLQYLNDPVNKEFAEGFLEATFYVEVDMKKEMGRKLQSKKTLTIKDYFQRDHHDNKIKGTQFFFEACYNDISNLLHIKHEINLIKSDLNPLDWITIVFSENLMTALVKAGGIHEGVILDKIFKAENIENFQTFRSITDPFGVIINEYFTVHVHEGSGVGIGKFILDWFTKKHKYICKDAEKILEVRNKLTNMLKESIENVRGANIIAATEKAIEIIKESLDTINYHYGIMRSGSEVRALSHGSKADSEEAKSARKTITRAALLKGIDYMHRLKEAKRKAEVLLNREADKRKLKEHFYIDCFNTGLYELDSGGIELAFKKFEEELLAKNKNKRISYDDVKNAAIAAKSWSDPAAREERAAAEATKIAAKVAAYRALENLRNPNVPIDIAKSTACSILTGAQFTEAEANRIADEMMQELKYDLTTAPAQTPKLKAGYKRLRAS